LPIKITIQLSNGLSTKKAKNKQQSEKSSLGKFLWKDVIVPACALFGAAAATLGLYDRFFPPSANVLDAVPV
jgi:hypothetical protein